MTWKEYIEGRKWHRGGKAGDDPTKRKRRGTFWTPDKKLARQYADPCRFDRKHDMQLMTARITPTKLFVGNDPAMARKLGILEQYDRLVEQGKKWAPSTDRWLEAEARKAGYDAQIIDKVQIDVLNPKAIKVLKIEQVPKWHGQRSRKGVGYTKGGRLSRSHRKGFKKVRFT